MRLFCLIFVALIVGLNAQIQICKFLLMDPTPSVTLTLYKCTADAVNDRICASENDYYEKILCEQKGGGAVNILTEFGVRYLLLGDAYANHYLALQS